MLFDVLLFFDVLLCKNGSGIMLFCFLEKKWEVGNTCIFWHLCLIFVGGKGNGNFTVDLFLLFILMLLVGWRH